MSDTLDSILRSQIIELVRQSDQTHLAIGRLLAESFYNNDRATYESRAPKDISLRLLALELRTNYDFPRSFSSLRQMLAAHFQEPDLRLSESEARALSWRARVELLRVHAPEEKAEWAHKAIAEKLSVSKLARRLSETHPPLRRPRTPRQRLLRLARRMERILSLWPDAPPDVAQTLRQLRDTISSAGVCTRPTNEGSQPPANCDLPTSDSPIVPYNCSLPPADSDLPTAENCSLLTDNCSLPPATCDLPTANLPLPPAACDLPTDDGSVLVVNISIPAAISPQPAASAPAVVPAPTYHLPTTNYSSVVPSPNYHLPSTNYSSVPRPLPLSPKNFKGKQFFGSATIRCGKIEVIT